MLERGTGIEVDRATLDANDLVCSFIDVNRSRPALTRRNECAMKENPNLRSALKTSCTVLFCAIANSALADPLDSSSLNALPNSFWTQKYMFGDWGGERTRLEQMGITFYGEYRDDFQGNVAGTDKNG